MVKLVTSLLTKKPNDPMPYEWGPPLEMDSEDVVTETNPVPAEGALC
jgi:hypothetical protein